MYVCLDIFSNSASAISVFARSPVSSFSAVAGILNYIGRVNILQVRSHCQQLISLEHFPGASRLEDILSRN
jgi:hypothetical protein